MVGEQIKYAETAIWKFNFEFYQQVATDALEADDTSMESQKQTKDNNKDRTKHKNWKLEIEFLKFQVKIKSSEF